jgi:outer membrane PBP1 activator LpoA protein
MRFLCQWRAGILVSLILACPLAEAASDRIALLLPQSGRLSRVAEAIRHGFLAAYYQDTRAAADSPSLHFYDSDAENIMSLLQKAADDGASLVVGPLDRERLEELARANTLPIPVLALNSVERNAGNLFQFSLAPEDEIQRLAGWMRTQGIRKPLLLATSDEASQRHIRIFQAAWLQGGQQDALPSATLDPARKGGVTASVRDLVRSPGKHDAFFLASPTLARQVQPALTYYRSTLPLYSMASAWDPTADVSGQKDLDGMRFCDLPWMLTGEARPEQQALYTALNRPVSSYDRLYAFGADAWTLVRQWRQMQAGQPLMLRSGTVQLDASLRLHRTPTCAEVRNGTATPLWFPETDKADAGSRS